MSDFHDTPAAGSAPVHVFSSDFLEFFTHVNPAVVPVIWVPVAVVFLLRGMGASAGARRFAIIGCAFLSGILLWTIVEYLLHRFIFHFMPRTPLQVRVAFLIHGVHHTQPRVKTRLVMPPLVSVPLAILFYAMIYGIVSILLGAGTLVVPLFPGFVIGYVAYDMIHYSLYHVRFQKGAMKILRTHHMRHHTQWDSRFGVSSALWDHVFRTEPGKPPIDGKQA